MTNKLNDEVYNIISGKSKVRFGTVIQTIASYLRDGEKSDRTTQNEKHYKNQEAKRLEAYVENHKLWVLNLDFKQYVSEGAEQRVYLKDTEYVIKLNDAIFYNSWYDYLINLLLHNYFFQDTAYELLGFTKENDVLYAVVKQNYVLISQSTDLKTVRLFMESNGFVNNRNNDYVNQELGLIIEDLHDENVLTKNGLLYFIDTVFYIVQ
jgi:hypothetical protein